MILVRIVMLSLALVAFSVAQSAAPAQDGAPEQSAASRQNGEPADRYRQAQDHQQLVELLGFEWTGSRLPTASLIRLSGLKVGQKVNYDILNDVCNKLTSTGLVSAVDYAYNVQPGKPGVVVSFNVWDEKPLLPATIFPQENAQLLWGCLEAADPIFTHELPNTRAALHFYATNLDRCLENGSQNKDYYTHATTACDVKGQATKIVFDIRRKEAKSASAR